MTVTTNKHCASKMQCFPLYSIMMAYDSPNVDYLRLCTNGDELAVLKTLLWEKVTLGRGACVTSKGAKTLCFFILVLQVIITFIYIIT